MLLATFVTIFTPHVLVKLKFSWFLYLSSIITKLRRVIGSQRRVSARYEYYWNPKKILSPMTSLSLKSCLVVMCKKICPGEDFDPGPTGEGCPCCCSLSFFMGSLSFAAWISKYVRAWCAEYNRASKSKKKYLKRKCWNRDMIHWHNHIIFYISTLFRSCLPLRNAITRSSRSRFSPSLFRSAKGWKLMVSQFQKPIMKNRFIQ